MLLIIICCFIFIAVWYVLSLEQSRELSEEEYMQRLLIYDVIDLVPMLNESGKFTMITEYDPQLYSRAVYSYSAIYYNKSTSSGWFEVNKEYAYIKELNDAYKLYYYGNDCNGLDILYSKFNTTEILANGKYCVDIVEDCNWQLRIQHGSACILEFIE